jgi:2'-5' RNA ligase
MTKRLFFAICPPSPLCQIIKQSITLPVESRPVAPENYHVTLVFLGLMDSELTVEICRRMGQVKSAPFLLQFRQITHWQKPKVLCLTDPESNESLIKLVFQIKTIVEQLGVPIETRSFQAHLTVAKKVLRPSFSEVNRIAWNAESFCLFESVSVSTGFSYNVIQKWCFL